MNPDDSFISGVTSVEAVRWCGDVSTGHLELLDQRLLPGQEHYVECHTADATADAIATMVVRGAPAIGLTAAYGIVLGAQELGADVSLKGMEHAFDVLARSRPTAVNLRWALERMRGILEECEGAAAVGKLFATALQIGEDDFGANLAMGDYGAELMGPDTALLTYCNTGSLATAGYGTALGVVRSTYRAGKLRRVYACETRPYLQGARLTMWELDRDGLPATLITDNMAGYMMQAGQIDAIVVGADRIAANGDTANKIGTYTLAVLAQHHSIPFYVAAPTSTIDLSTPDGSGIPIEQRSANEVVELGGVRIAPADVEALHPAFDVTPAQLITAIITERGVATTTTFGYALPKMLADGIG